MTIERRRIALATGVALDVTLAGDHGDPLIFLHGFPESARTWRHQIAALAPDHRIAAPDQRGYARSDKPEGIAAYAVDAIVGDLLALADTLGFDRFTLIGHDWGGAMAWAAALRHPDRIGRLAIANAPHPLLFQRALIDDPAQRAASQYMRAFRDPGMAGHIQAMGLEAFFDKSFAPHIDLDRLGDERGIYLDQWTQPGAIEAMLNWYRATPMLVPATGETVARPGWIDQPFPRLAMPVLVIWGMRDRALLSAQLDGLNALIDDLTIARVPDAGHFVPWEAPDAVTSALRAFLKRPH
ncbi:alpha/beta hydrolase [Sphingomonas sp. 1P06PA]|uniref:alpha/beta fold hydrolase n=1 Tax=Sphingomonas sp. 1P06PA TaxID=554121 RepID=UPI0039A6BEC5